MILTLTPNPSLDLLFAADRLVWDDANRLDEPRRRPGGQGINLVRAAIALGSQARAVAPLGGPVGDELRQMLEREGTPLRAITIDDETRTFVGVHETETGRSLLLNPRGPTLSAEEKRRLLDTTIEEIEAHDPDWVVCCGSILRGLPEDFYATVGREARSRGARFVPDCDGTPLRLAAEAGCDLLVPNAHEAARLLGQSIDDVVTAARAAPTLLRFGATLAVITLGAEGAIAATGEGVWHARAPRIDHGSAVGAGDALLAAILIALERGAATPEALRAGVAAGAATLLSKGSELISAGDVASLEREATVEEIR